MSPIRQVTIVQTYIPTYRRPFFNQLRAALSADQVDLKVVTSQPPAGQVTRNDAVQLDWGEQVRGRQLRLGPRNVLLSSSSRFWVDSDAVICMQQGSSWDTNHALMTMRRRGIRVGLWGHIRPYTSPGNPMDLWIERLQLRRADHIFAYTGGGAEYARQAGVPEDAITNVNNTVETSDLVAARDALTAAMLADFQSKHQLRGGKTFAFIGGLDQSKRITLLSEALDLVWDVDPQIRLLVGGTGDQADLLDRSVARGQTVMLGRVASAEKALMVGCSTAIVMPGRIGLVALDALVLGRPILTTNWPFHAPEAEYLVDGESKFESDDSSGAFAKLMLGTAEASSSCQWRQPSWNYPTMSGMVQNFATGIQRLLDGSP